MARSGEAGPLGSLWCDGGVRPLVSDDVWASLTSSGSRRTYAAGEVLMSEGGAGTQVIVLIEGRVKVTRHESDGTEVLLAIRGAGEIIGEMAVLDETVASATVTALRSCATRRLPAREFIEFVRSHDLALPMVRYASARRRESDQIRIELSTLPVPRRLVRTLLRLMDAIGTPDEAGIVVDLGVPQEDLAHAIGASRSQVAACLAQLRERGVLKTSRRRVLIVDPEELRSIDAGRARS
jgi:CRP/FNR family cyclic AMP-dependent transcriptional regulator